MTLLVYGKSVHVLASTYHSHQIKGIPARVYLTLYRLSKTYTLLLVTYTGNGAYILSKQCMAQVLVHIYYETLNKALLPMVCKYIMSQSIADFCFVLLGDISLKALE